MPQAGRKAKEREPVERGTGRMATRAKFHRFGELTETAINVDYQVHTTQTDGEATVADILAAAQAKKLGGIAFTEHVRKATQWFPSFVSEVRTKAAAFPDLRVHVGCEAKALDIHGSLDAPQTILDASDLVLGSVHRFPDGKGGYLDFDTMSAAAVADMEFALAMGLVKSAPISVLAHPGGMYERRHGKFPADYFRELMHATLERGIAIEINSSYLVDFDSYLQMCAEIDPIVSIGSDAHKLQELGTCRDKLRARGVTRQ